MNKEKIIFIGTPKESIPFIEKLSHSFQLEAVITKPDSKKGKRKEISPSPIKKAAINRQIEVFTPRNLQESSFLEKMRDIEASLAILASYSKKIPKDFLDIFEKGVICFHPSLLPIYRGPTPIQRAILNGNKETGISFFLMDDKFDHGPLIYQEKVKIEENENNEILREKLFNLGANKIAEVIQNYLNGLISLKEQEHSRASYTPILKRKDGYFDPKEKAEMIWRKFKAFHPWPGIWTYWQGKRIKVIEASFESGKLSVKKIQLEGKREMSLEEFKNGFKDFNLF